MSISPNSHIAIIDDDLSPWRARDFPDAQGILGDPDVDDFKALWSVALEQGFVAETDDAETKLELLSGDDVINSLVTSASLREQHPVIWDRYFGPVVEARNSSLSWYRLVQATLHKYNAVVTEFSSYPENAEIAQAELLIVDLIINDDPNPLEKVTRYLKGLYEDRENDNATLPLVILVSQNAAELEQHRQDFRHEAQISASMLRLLDKSELSDSEIGPIHFELLWHQMADEVHIANFARGLVSTLSDAANDAEASLRKVLWNLDCDALLRMYQTCVDDSTSFADYMIEFVSRSVAWQIRSHEALLTTIEGVEQELSDRSTSGTNGLARRFHSAGQKDEAAIRELMHHFHWIPRSQVISINDIEIDTLRTKLNEHLPYGAVIAFGPVIPGAKLYVHVTQPCDLLRFETRFEIDSLTFVEGEVTDYGTSNQPSEAKWIVRALKGGENYFDLDLQLKRGIAERADRFVASFKERGAMVVGQLRPDVTREIGHQLARYSTRIDRPRFTDVRTRRYNIITGVRGAASQFVETVEGNRLCVRAVIRDLPDDKKKCFHLLDGAPEQIAIWCEKHFSQQGVRALEVADILKDELFMSGTTPLGDQCEVRLAIKPDKIRNTLRSMGCGKPTGIVLVPEDVASEIQ